MEKNKNKGLTIGLLLCVLFNFILCVPDLLNNLFNTNNVKYLCDFKAEEISNLDVINSHVYLDIQSRIIFIITKFMEEDINRILVILSIVIFIIGLVFAIKLIKSNMKALSFIAIYILLGSSIVNFTIYSVGKCQKVEKDYNIGCDIVCPTSIFSKEIGFW